MFPYVPSSRCHAVLLPVLARGNPLSAGCLPKTLGLSKLARLLRGAVGIGANGLLMTFVVGNSRNALQATISDNDLRLPKPRTTWHQTPSRVTMPSHERPTLGDPGVSRRTRPMY
jgi:hypothetical protein